MASRGALVVIGSGPGVGRSTAQHFAGHGFKHIILLSRDESRLADDAKAVHAASSDVKVDTIRIDVEADEAEVKKVLASVDDSLKASGQSLEVVLYNAARVGPSKILEWDASGLEADLRITTVSLYIALQWAIPKLLETAESPSKNPAFLTTSGGLYRDPFPFLFSLSAGKASQFNLMYSFHKKYEPRIHIATVPVSGFIRNEAKVTSSKAVAEQFWKLYEQAKGVEGQVSVEMEDPDYYPSVEGFRQQIEGS